VFDDGAFFAVLGGEIPGEELPYLASPEGDEVVVFWRCHVG